ncbi:MAG TPA: helix-turn-helix domain-containing protein [Casimicrobiaceae bacterium]|nr:helix-turn-helix domain-containing protein [Casimicrobiaceae bacterium]
MTALEAHNQMASAPPVVGPGARLKAARETAGLSLDQAAQQLKLAPRQVRALEDEDFAHLPGRTFARGFLRNYARLLNLDADDLLALMPDASHAPALNAPALQSTGTMIAELPSRENGKPGLARWIIPLVLVACVVAAAGYEWYRGGLGKPGETARAPAAKAETAAIVVAPAATSSTPLSNPLADMSKAEPAPAAQPMQSSAMEAAVSTPEGAVAATTTTTPADAQTAPAAASGSAPLQLVYGGPSWTEVRDRDGQVLIARLMSAGSEQAIRGAAPFDIVIGNASAVWVTYQGKPVDLAPYTRQNVARLRLL